MNREQQKAAEKEAAKFPDIDVFNFVSRGRLIVLQTSGDYFEKMPKSEQLNVIDYAIKSLEFLKKEISK